MKFCPECGTKIEGMKFCPECGYKVGELQVPEYEATPVPNQVAPYDAPAPPQHQRSQVHDQLLVDQNYQSSSGIDNEQHILDFQTYVFGLEDKKQNVGGKVDLSIPITKYTLTTERLIIERKSAVSALSSKGHEEINVEDISEINVKRGLTDRVAGTGDIHLVVAGKKMVLKNILDSDNVKDAIRSASGKRKKFLEAQGKVQYNKFM